MLVAALYTVPTRPGEVLQWGSPNLEQGAAENIAQAVHSDHFFDNLPLKYLQDINDTLCLTLFCSLKKANSFLTLSESQFITRLRFVLSFLRFFMTVKLQSQFLALDTEDWTTSVSSKNFKDLTSFKE